MSAMLTIKLTNGKRLPCYTTMGALRRFKRLTGQDPATCAFDDTDTTLTFLYCMTSAACSAEGVPLDMTEEEFADRLTPQAVADYFAAMNAETQPKKKTAPTAPRL